MCSVPRPSKESSKDSSPDYDKSSLRRPPMNLARGMATASSRDCSTSKEGRQAAEDRIGCEPWDLSSARQRTSTAVTVAPMLPMAGRIRPRPTGPPSTSHPQPVRAAHAKVQHRRWRRRTTHLRSIRLHLRTTRGRAAALDCTLHGSYIVDNPIAADYCNAHTSALSVFSSVV